MPQQRGEGRSALRRDIEGPRQGIPHHAGVTHPAEVHEDDAIRVEIGVLAGELGRQPGLAGAPRAEDGEQPGVPQQAAQVRQLAPAADEAREPAGNRDRAHSGIMR